MRRGIADSNCDGNSNSRSKRYAYRDSNSDRDSNINTDADSNTDAYTHANAKGYADAQTSADSAPSRVVGNAFRRSPASEARGEAG